MSTKRRKTAKETTILWYLVKELLAVDPAATDAHMHNAVRSKFEEELPIWLASEARFVYSQKVKRGEISPVGGHATMEQAQDMFNKLSATDRSKFLDWAQFTTMQFTRQ